MQIYGVENLRDIPGIVLGRVREFFTKTNKLVPSSPVESYGRYFYLTSSGSSNTFRISDMKEGPWVNYRLADGAGNPYVANLLGNLRYWLEEDGEVTALVARLPEIHRETICGG